MARVTAPQPLARSHERAAFDCGRESLNIWFKRHAWHNQAAGISRTNVICDRDTGVVVGYVTLSGSAIRRQFLAKSQQRSKTDPLPVTLLGQLAVATSHQGEGHARSLLAFALKTALAASRQVGSFGVITHPVDDGIRAFYERLGFQDLPFDPGRSMIVRFIDLEKTIG